MHCRARASCGPFEGELTTDECKKVIDSIASFSTPDHHPHRRRAPYCREDIFEIIEYGREKGLRMVIAINGTLLDRNLQHKLKDSGIMRVCMSLDGKDANKSTTPSGVYPARLNP